VVSLCLDLQLLPLFFMLLFVHTKCSTKCL
jgi:hypothetical protein